MVSPHPKAKFCCGGLTFDVKSCFSNGVVRWQPSFGGLLFCKCYWKEPLLLVLIEHGPFWGPLPIIATKATWVWLMTC